MLFPPPPAELSSTTTTYVLLPETSENWLLLKETSIVTGSGLTEILDTEEIDCVTTVSSLQHKLRSPFKESSIITAEILVGSLNCLLLILLQDYLSRMLISIFLWLDSSNCWNVIQIATFQISFKKKKKYKQ